MRRLFLACWVLVTWLASPAIATPPVFAEFDSGGLRVTLSGTFAGAYYLGYRADAPTGPFTPLAPAYSLCTGECFVTDGTAVPGRTYWYRFDFESASGTIAHGPFPVVAPRVALTLRAWPSPARGPAFVAVTRQGARTGAPLATVVTVVDAQGRIVRRLFAGPLSAAAGPLAWDGRDDGGRPVPAGAYFVRAMSDGLAGFTRVLLAR